MVINPCNMKSLTKKLIVALLIALILTPTAYADLASRINSIINAPANKKSTFSIHIKKAGSRKTIYAHNSNTPLTPASNMKLITTAAALKYLGPDFQYKTTIGLCGDTLVVIGSGDPLLGDGATGTKNLHKTNSVFNDIADALIKNNVTGITDIVIDSTIFDDQLVHPNWPREQLNRHYACEISGLNYNENCIGITTKNTNGKIVILLDPQTDYVKITNKVKPIQQGKSAAGSYRTPNKPNNIIVYGKCKKQVGPFAVAIERPAAFFGYLLAENLVARGINVSGQLIEKAVPNNCNPKTLTQFTTPIQDCLARCNKDSFQLAAESLYKTIAAQNSPKNKNGSWTRGRELISKYLTDLGVDQNEFYIDDGSGLSNKNKLSANTVTAVLNHVYKSKYWNQYRHSLAVGGLDGTIAKYFKEKKYKGKILGKTGYISGAKAFSGICLTDQGDYIFAVLANNTNGRTRDAINDIAKTIIDEYSTKADR
ncbi:MAG: D-alanyl-D-alanine carboxypeptidase/D-alanyl-D-alanine-endopeptidase [Sedimentisphaerales bacterium]|nr:D-alanyl-D-alanine carboxypeptidase/D-alanyl-D-alanine-endopeptidase [Sedimentisphaerales bacterium]